MLAHPIYDVLVIGAGPTGLACAIDAQNAGFSVILVDKGCSPIPSSTTPPG